MQVITVFSQEKRSLKHENYWHDGSIMTKEGSELSGRLQYNERLGILRFEDGDGERTFTPKSVVAFEFFDVTIDRQRLYYSIEFQEENDVMKRPWFFEVLMDFKTFAVISRVDPIDAKEEKFGPDGRKRTKVAPQYTVDNPVELLWNDEVITLVEKIYFLSGEDQLEPYLRVTRRTVTGLAVERNKTAHKILDKKLLLKFFSEEEVDKMKEYAEENDLDTETKEDFVKMLEFANTLRKK